jgi:hypothetical protein
MKTVMVAFEFKDDDKMPIGHKIIDCHLIFDVKLDLTKKARYVAGGYQTDPPKQRTYSSVVSRDSVRITFLVAALNDLEVSTCDISGAYFNAETETMRKRDQSLARTKIDPRELSTDQNLQGEL